jgi:single-stranded DNA-binding protein
MNQLVVSGRISKEISVKGKVGYFTLANDRDYPYNKDQNGNKVSNFLTCKIIGEKRIEMAQKQLTKGTAVIVAGHYFRDSWKSGNEYKEFNYVMVERYEFQQGKANADESTPVEYSGQNAVADTHTEEVSQSNEDIVPDDIDLDSLPFR